MNRNRLIGVVFSFVAGVVLPIAAGIAASLWTSLSFWYEISQGLIALLGFLAASLVQVMPITANFLQSDRLTPSEATRLTNSLTRQQHYWIGLLAATIVSLIVIIFAAALKSRIDKLPILIKGDFIFYVSWEQVCCFFVASSFSFVLLRIFSLFQGILSLHKLRGDLVVAGAKRAEQESRKNKSGNETFEVKMPLNLPVDYGKIVDPPNPFQ